MRLPNVLFHLRLPAISQPWPLLLACCALPSVASVVSAQSVAPATTSPQQASNRGSWGDQGNGSFLNPVLPGDFSDLDAIRLGKDFYAISSTMQYAPGMLVLHSTDLVNWQIVGHVVTDLTALDPELGWDRMNREGRGIWAGAIRYHAGRFWVYFGTPDGGIYLSTATRVEGTWSAPKLVLTGQGWDDPCPFWDDDGRAYLVATRFAADADGQKYRIHLFPLTADGNAIVPNSDRILHQSRGSEANKMYKIDGVYLHYFSEVRPEGRVAMMERSSTLDGPWEIKQLNHVHGTLDKEPNQGGLIQFEDGRWWFLTHQGKGDWEGRAGVLLPVTWIDGWPILGEPGPDGIGEMVWGGSKPIASQSHPQLFVDDDFHEPVLPPAWEWRYQPRPDMWLLSGTVLRLKAFAPLPDKGFSGVRNVLTQRAVRSQQAEVTVQINLAGLVNGQEAGLAHFARTSCRIAIVQQAAERRLVRFDQDNRLDGPILSATTIWLRSAWGVDGSARFAYSQDGTDYTDIGLPCKLSWGSYRGDRIGIYTFSTNGEKGYADFQHFRYSVQQ